jgi:hypothetical protein
MAIVIRGNDQLLEAVAAILEHDKDTIRAVLCDTFECSDEDAQRAIDSLQVETGVHIFASVSVADIREALEDEDNEDEDYPATRTLPDDELEGLLHRWSRKGFNIYDDEGCLDLFEIEMLVTGAYAPK